MYETGIGQAIIVESYKEGRTVELIVVPSLNVVCKAKFDEHQVVIVW